MRTTYTTVFKGKSFLAFYGAIRASQSKTSYCLALRDYTKFLHANKLIASDTDADLLLADSKTVETWLIAYINDHKERKLSYSIMQLRKAAIRLFYDMNDIAPNWKKIAKHMPEDVQHTDRPYTRKEIQKMLSVSDLRAKTVLLLMASAGLRAGAVSELKYGSLVEIEKYSLYQINVYTGTRQRYTTFCTPECKNAIDEYIDQRKRYGEEITGISPLLRDQFDKSDVLKSRDKARPIKVDVIKNLARFATIKAGLRQLEPTTENADYRRKRYDVKASHGLRKFFDTEATLAGTHPIFVEMLMGHNMALKGAYFKPSPLALLEGNDKMGGYIQAIDSLTINDEHRLKMQVKELQIENLELLDVRKEIDAIKQQLRKQ